MCVVLTQIQNTQEHRPPMTLSVYSVSIMLFHVGTTIIMLGTIEAVGSRFGLLPVLMIDFTRVRRHHLTKKENQRLQFHNVAVELPPPPSSVLPTLRNFFHPYTYQFSAVLYLYSMILLCVNVHVSVSNLMTKEQQNNSEMNCNVLIIMKCNRYIRMNTVYV